MSQAPTIRIAPSLLGADFTRLAEQVALVENGGADLLHLDIMDGHFVPNLSFGVPVVESVSRCTRLFLDTHLMLSDPLKYAQAFAEAGSKSITFHIETVEHPTEAVSRIRALGVKIGVALNPGTPAEAIFEIIEQVDIVLVMTVWPGFGGQKFMRECLPKIETIADHLSDEQWLEVDGGINLETSPLVAAAGADTLVAGNAVFRAADPVQMMAAIRAAARRAAGESTGSSP